MNWEWLDGIPYFVVTVEWASGKRRKKEYGQGMFSSWNTPDMKPDHAAGACTKFTGHAPAQVTPSPFLYPNIHSQREAKGEKPLTPPVSIPPKTALTPPHSWSIPYLHTAEAPGLHFLLTSSLPRWTPALPRKRSVKETQLCHPLWEILQQTLSVDKTPNIMFLIFFFDF